MSREEFIGKLEMVYVGDRNAFNDIVCAYDSLLCKNEKASEYIEKQKKKMYKSRNKIALFILMKLENILQNGSDSQ